MELIVHSSEQSFCALICVKDVLGHEQVDNVVTSWLHVLFEVLLTKHSNVFCV